MDTNEETTEPEGQESEVVSNESELPEDKETEGQEETASAKRKLWKMRQMYLSRTRRLPLPTLTA